jgi:hypothetical protein
MALETEYRGHRVHYAENGDCWSCLDLSIEAGSLSKVKAQIDATYLKLRKKSAVTVVVLGRNRGVAEGKAMDARPIRHRTYQATPGWKHEIGVMRPKGEGQGKNFEKAGDLALPTPEVYVAIDEAKRLRKLAIEADELADDAWAAIPRITQEDVAGLLRACTETIEET